MNSLGFREGFSSDIDKFKQQYRTQSPVIADRFESAVNEALAKIKEAPTAVGHFIRGPEGAVREFRRCNLKGFPLFIIYGVSGQMILIGGLLHARSRPAEWLRPFRPPWGN